MLRKFAKNAAAFVFLCALAVPIIIVTYAAVIFLQLVGDGALMFLGLAAGPTPGAWFLGGLLAMPLYCLVDRDRRHRLAA